MQPERIVSIAPIDRIAIDILQQVAPVEISPSPDEPTVLTLLEGTIGLVARGTEGGITRKIMENCPGLRVIGRPGVGYDTVDVAFATRRKIPVVYAPIGGFAVAEAALAHVFDGSEVTDPEVVDGLEHHPAQEPRGQLGREVGQAPAVALPGILGQQLGHVVAL